MRKHRVAGWLIAGTLLAPSMAAVAGDVPQTAAASQPPRSTADDQLDEVLVEGSRAKPKPPTWKAYQVPFDWLARLVGSFTVDGSIELQAPGDSGTQQMLAGQAQCVGFGVAPGVECVFDIRWPEPAGTPRAVSALDHAVMLFGSDPVEPPGAQQFVPRRRSAPPDAPAQQHEPDVSGISWILVDGAGIAETAVGQMQSPDIMQSQSKCAIVPGDCEHVVRITAMPDLKSIEFRIDLVVDARQIETLTFVLHRMQGTAAVVYGRRK